MKKIILLALFVLGVMGTMQAQQEISISNNADTVYGTVELEVMYDGDYFYVVKITEGELTFVNQIWINGGSSNADMEDPFRIDCDCDDYFEEGDKFIAVLVKSERVGLSMEDGEKFNEECYRPLIMKKLIEALVGE